MCERGSDCVPCISGHLQVLLLWYWFWCIHSSGEGHCAGWSGHFRVHHQWRAHAAKGVCLHAQLECTIQWILMLDTHGWCSVCPQMCESHF